MSKQWTQDLAEAEAEALDKQATEDRLHERFDAARTRARAEGLADTITDTLEFKEWMAARRASDLAWGAWAMQMDAKPAGQ